MGPRASSPSPLVSTAAHRLARLKLSIAADLLPLLINRSAHLPEDGHTVYHVRSSGRRSQDLKVDVM